MLIDIGALTFAFSAGFFTLFSPCGFPMLPGYIGYYLGTQSSPKRTLLGGVIVSAGLLVVFSTIGLIASFLSSFIVIYLPFFTLLAGIIVSFMGIILVTGPTGSGKTTTLYASLNTINTPERKIITIENPVEYVLPHALQVQVMEPLTE